MKSILVVLALTVGGTALAAQSPTQVQVTNTPLPVSVTNTNQSVTVTNSSLPVQVGNTSPIPVAVSSTEEPFQFSSAPGSFTASGGQLQLFTVPAGKRLVVEHVSAVLNLSGPNGLAAAEIFISGGPNDEIDCHQTGADASNHWFSCSVMTKFYVDAGVSLSFAVQSVDSVGGQYRISVSGHYVPAP